MRKVPLYGLMLNRFVQVQELIHHRLIVYMIWDSAEAVILGNSRYKSLTIVLSECLCIPRDTFLYIASVQTGLVH